MIPYNVMVENEMAEVRIDRYLLTPITRDELSSASYRGLVALSGSSDIEENAVKYSSFFVAQLVKLLPRKREVAGSNIIDAN